MIRSLWILSIKHPKTADLSTTLRFGRDDKFVVGLISSVETNLSSRPEKSWAYSPPKVMKTLGLPQICHLGSVA